MIVDNKDNGSQSNYQFPLTSYFGKDYSFQGNILIDLQKSNTDLYIEIPYINKDAGHLFKLWFFDRLLLFLDNWVGKNHFNHEYNIIRYYLAYRETPDSLIVQQKTVNACIFGFPKYSSANNGTYSFRVFFPDESLQKEFAELIEQEFFTLIKQFRKDNNENTL